MEFSSQKFQTQICRKAYIPNSYKDEVKELLGYTKIRSSDENKKNFGVFRSDLCSEKIYNIFQANNLKNDETKKKFNHEEVSKNGQASLKRSIVFDSSLGCCVPIFTRKPGCSRMKLDIIGYGEAENYGTQFERTPNNSIDTGLNSSSIHRNFNQHFSGCSTNIIGEVRNAFGGVLSKVGYKTSKVNKSSVHIENDFYMPEEGSSYENSSRVQHSVSKGFNGSHLAFSDGFLTSIS